MRATMQVETKRSGIFYRDGYGDAQLAFSLTVRHG